MEAKRTPFYYKHLEKRAHMVNFSGFEMPLFYRGIVPEHLAVRASVGMFDLSHMGEFIVRGDGAFDFVQRMTTNDVLALSMYQIQYSTMCYDDGGIVDDLLVYRLPDGVYMLVVNASNIEKDFDWLRSHLPSSGVVLEDVSDRTGLLAIQGPRAEAVMQKLTDYPLDNLAYYRSAEAEVAGRKILFSRTGYTGEDGFELYLPPDACEPMWDAVEDAGREFDIKPVGLGARDSLRLEMKYCLYGNDIDKTTNPIEAGLGWIVKVHKGDFVGRDAIMRVKEEGTKRKLTSFVLRDRAFPRQHYPIKKNGEKIGEVTSGVFSPSLEKGIALGYIPREYAKIGETVYIEVRGRDYPAEIIKPPFWKKGSHK